LVSCKARPSSWARSCPSASPKPNPDGEAAHGWRRDRRDRGANARYPARHHRRDDGEPPAAEALASSERPRRRPAARRQSRALSARQRSRPWRGVRLGAAPSAMSSRRGRRHRFVHRIALRRQHAHGGVEGAPELRAAVLGGPSAAAVSIAPLAPVVWSWPVPRTGFPPGDG
jgi:hypothetical protein